MSRLSVGIVGTGNVGMAGAFAIYMQQLCSELVLVDMNHNRAAAEALDMMQGQGLTGRTHIRAGDYADLGNCQLIVLTAGVAQKPGETRLDLLNRNAVVMKSIAAELDRHAPDAVVVVASNPVDIMTWMLRQLSQRPSRRILGTGTMLDTSRLRTLLGDHYHVDPVSVHGYILGEHGDSEFAAWSTVSIGGKPICGETVLDQPWDAAAMDGIYQQVRNAAYTIINGKGYTNWAIGVVIAKLVDIILSDRQAIQPVSTFLTGQCGVRNVCLSLPARVGMGGINQVIELDLRPDELEALHRSAATISDSIAQITL